MKMAISKTIAEASNKHFLTKVRYYLVGAAVAVMNEADTEPNHINRLAYAKVILKGAADIQQIGMAIVSNATISAKIEADQDYDGDLAYVITTILNAFANAES